MKKEIENPDKTLLSSQRLTQIFLFLFAFIAFFGGTLQMYLGQPDSTPRLDNIHRFLAGIYLGSGMIVIWTALTIRKQNTLVFLIAIGGFLGAAGRLFSMYIVGLPEPATLWLGYLSSEIIVPIILIITQLWTNRRLKEMNEL